MEHKNPKQTKPGQTPTETFLKKPNKQTNKTNQSTKKIKPPNTKKTNQNTHRTLLQNIMTHCVSLLDMEEEECFFFSSCVLQIATTEELTMTNVACNWIC